MLYYSFFVKKLTQSVDSINTLSLSSWIKINEGEGLSSLYRDTIWNKIIRSVAKTTTLRESIDLQERWFRVFDTYLKRYDMPEEYRAIQNKKVQILKLRCTYLTTGKEYHRTAIRALEVELDKLENPKQEKSEAKKDVTIGQIIAKTQKELPFQIDSKKMMTQQYYDLIN